MQYNQCQTILFRTNPNLYDKIQQNKWRKEILSEHTKLPRVRSGEPNTGCKTKLQKKMVYACSSMYQWHESSSVSKLGNETVCPHETRSTNSPLTATKTRPKQVNSHKSSWISADRKVISLLSITVWSLVHSCRIHYPITPN